MEVVGGSSVAARRARELPSDWGEDGANSGPEGGGRMWRRAARGCGGGRTVPTVGCGREREREQRQRAGEGGEVAAAGEIRKGK